MPHKPNDLTIVAGYEDLLLRNHLDSLEALFAVPNDEGLSKPGLEGWRERLQLTLEADGSARAFYLKRFCRPPGWARRALRRSGSGAASHAGAEWTWMHRLAAAGIPCVKPVAFGEERHGFKEHRSAILTEAVGGASLEQWLRRWSEADRPTIRRLIPPLASLVARLHEYGVFHRDLYLSHVFLDPALPAEASLCLIDLQRVVRPLLRRRRWVVKDLASLNFSASSRLVSTTDRLRWLRCYLGSRRFDAPARRLLYRVVGKTEHIARHESRRTARFAQQGDS